MYTDYLKANSIKSTADYAWYVQYHEEIDLSRKRFEERLDSEGDPVVVSKNDPTSYNFFTEDKEDILGFNTDPFKPQKRFRDYYEKQTGKIFRPPEWKHNSLDSLLPATRIYCSGEDDLNEVRQCVVQRDLVNLGNNTIIRLPKYKKSGYQQLWDKRKEEEKEDDLTFVLTLPPNFALYTYAPIITEDIFNEHKKKS